MQQTNIPIGPSATDAAVQRRVVKVCDDLGLMIASRSTLAMYPGSVHWHVKKPSHTGTLEITWWPMERRLWLSVHANRSGDWVDNAVMRVKEELSSRLS